jgi:hypothetical protein
LKDTGDTGKKASKETLSVLDEKTTVAYRNIYDMRKKRRTRKKFHGIETNICLLLFENCCLLLGVKGEDGS